MLYNVVSFWTLEGFFCNFCYNRLLGCGGYRLEFQCSHLLYSTCWYQYENSTICKKKHIRKFLVQFSLPLMLFFFFPLYFHPTSLFFPLFLSAYSSPLCLLSLFSLHSSSSQVHNQVPNRIWLKYENKLSNWVTYTKE